MGVVSVPEEEEGIEGGEKIQGKMRADRANG